MNDFDDLINVERALLQFRDFDEWMRRSEETLPPPSETHSAARIASMLFDLSKKHLFMLRVISLKLMEIGRGIVAAKADENASVLLSLARSFLEHTASISYHRKIIRLATSEIPKTNGTEKLYQVLERHEKKLFSLFYGSSDTDRQSKFVHINDMIDTMADDFDNLKKIYAYLCDFVHPNYGSNKIVSSGTLGTGVLLPAYSMLKEETGRALTIVNSCARYTIKCQMDISIELLTLQGWIELASHPKMKPTSIFVFNSRFDGDGKTKNTALFFSKAKTHQDAIKALYEYLQQRNLRITEKGQQDFEGSFYFEQLITTGGALWVKYRFPF